MRIRIGFGLTTTIATIIKQPEEPDRRMERADGAAAVERHDRDQVEEVQEEPDEGEADEQVGAAGLAGDQEAAAPTDPRIGPASATRASFQASSGSSFIPMTAPRKGMKSGALAGTP